MNQENLKPVAQPNHPDERHDAAFEPLESCEVQCQYPEHRNRRDRRRNKHSRRKRKAVRHERRSNQQVQTQRCSKELRQVCRDGRNLRAHPQTPCLPCAKNVRDSSAEASSPSRCLASPPGIGSGSPSHSTTAVPTTSDSRTGFRPEYWSRSSPGRYTPPRPQTPAQSSSTPGRCETPAQPCRPGWRAPIKPALLRCHSGGRELQSHPRRKRRSIAFPQAFTQV